MNKKASIIITLGLVVAMAIVFTNGTNTKESGQVVQNTEIRDGIQYVTIDAKGGYSPIKTSAKAGIPTKLVVKTDGTYDCSSSLAIKSLDYQKVLSQTGEEIIDIGIPKAGEPLLGVCGMGMYNFEVDFS